MTIDFSANPYFDDYDPKKEFYKILFRPGYAVQARELTQLQTILQQQITRQGDSLFKHGDMVIPGQMSYDNNAYYVILQPTYSGINVDTFLPKLVGETTIGSSGLTGLVIAVSISTPTSPSTIYVKYTNTGTDSNSTYIDNEIITVKDGAYSFQASTNATGIGTIASISQGIFYINGNFVLVEPQSIVISGYSQTPTSKIGLTVSEEIITPEMDETLLDNALGSYNYAAPGAHRYFIGLTLTQYDLSYSIDNSFVELLRVSNGVLQKLALTSDYSVLEKTLATRTFDESGNYTVSPFAIDIRESRNNDRGVWTPSTIYNFGDVVSYTDPTSLVSNTYVSKTLTPTSSSALPGIPPIHITPIPLFDGNGSNGVLWDYNNSPYYNRGVSLDGIESQLSIGIEPGSAYIHGYQIDKIATAFYPIDKSRTTDYVENANIAATVGNFVYVTNIFNLPPVSSMGIVQIYNNLTTTSHRGTHQGTLIGTAKVALFEWDSGAVGSQNAIYKMSLLDITMKSGYDFTENAKSFYYSGTTIFTSDINPYMIPKSGLLTVVSGGIVTGTTNTTFTQDVTVGSYISIGSTICQVVSISSDQNITIDNATLNVTNASYGLVHNAINESNNASLIFPLPIPTIHSIRHSDGSFQNTYTVYETMTGNVAAGSNTLTVGTASAGATMISSENNSNYIITRNDTGAVINPLSITVNLSTVTFILPGTFSASTVCTVIGAVNKSGSSVTEKTKTLNFGSTASYVSFNTAVLATVPTLSLGKPDCYRVVNVMMKTGAFTDSNPPATYDIDITDRYSFDNGQRLTHYGLGAISLISGFLPPTAPIQVMFEYFSHSAGDYCSVNSYDSAIPYGSIQPLLRDSLDFRPLMSSTSTFSSVSIPKRGYDQTLDFSYYLANTQKIGMDIYGNTFNVSGTPSLSPSFAEDPNTGMVLCSLTLAPYTFDTTTSNVKLTMVDNKRYTMRDIGKLEKRIGNLEYYTSLSLLEQNTQSMVIPDINGMNSVKNGFIVDNFTGHSIGNVNSIDYICSVDMQNNLLRPSVITKNVNLIEKYSLNSDRSNSHYSLTGDVITLPIKSHIPFIKQGFGSRLENVNPFAIFTFIGSVAMNPSSDNWFDTVALPDVVTNVMGDFNTISTLASKANALGTVWNSWQTVWSGTPVATGTNYYTAGDNWANNRALSEGYTQISISDAINLNGLGNRNAPARQLVVQTLSTSSNQARTGINTSVVATIDNVVTSNRIVSSAVIPYIRSRNVLVQVHGLKPSTTFFPFFDNTIVASYCTPSSSMIYTLSSNQDFDYSTNVGGDATLIGRQIGTDVQNCLNLGDLIVGQTSGATAVVVGAFTDFLTSVKTLSIVNIKGTFTPSEQIKGSVPSSNGTFATGNVVSVAKSNIGDSLTTNLSGNVSLIFNIPNTSSLQFRCGAREFKLMDNSNATGAYTSNGKATYNASGILNTTQSTVNAVRNATLVQNQVSDQQTIVSTSQRVISDTGWYDPLAESFLIDSTGGAFLTKVDIFLASKDSALPITLEIREMINGFPGIRILPFSTVTLMPDKVHLSSNKVLMPDGSYYPTFDTPTTFTFSSPVYVNDATEYCFVLRSDSNNYNCWISQLGDTVPGTNQIISKQPYAGVMFLSQNASTWTPDQSKDIMFTMYKAQFDISAVGNVQFVNDILPYDRLENDPIQYVIGSTNARVWHKNHGRRVGDTIKIIGAVTDITGVLNTSINATHQISSVDLDSYVISGLPVATKTGYDGGNNVSATSAVIYDTIMPQIQVQSFAETNTSYSLSDGLSSAVGVTANDNNTFITPSYVTPEILPSDLKSLFLNVELSSTNDSLSPVIDTDRLSMIAINNIVNEPTYSITNITDVDYTNVFSGTSGAFSFSKMMTTAGSFIIGKTYHIVSIGLTDFTLIGASNNNVGVSFIATGKGTGTGTATSGSYLTSAVSAVRTSISSILVGQYIHITNAPTNNGIYLVTGNIDNETTGTISLDGVFLNVENSVALTSVSTVNLFVNEISANGSTSAAKYITNPIRLALPSTSVRINFSANIPTESGIDVYYKSTLGSGSNIYSTPYTLVSPTVPATKVQNGNPIFSDVDYNFTIPSFDTIQIKLVMKSINSSAVPKVQALRVIACA